MLAIDPQARSSMWEDLERRRPTEIDYLQGAIVAMAAKVGVPVPMNARIAELVARGRGCGRRLAAAHARSRSPARRMNA